MNDIKPQSRYQAEKTKRLFDKRTILTDIPVKYEPSEQQLDTLKSEYFNGWEMWIPVPIRAARPF